MFQTASVMLKDRRTATFSCCANYWCLPRHSAGMQTYFRALSFIYDFPSVAFPWGGITLIESFGTRLPCRPVILCGSCQHSAPHHYISHNKQKWNVAVWEAWVSHHNRIRLKICKPDPNMLHNTERLRGHSCWSVIHSSAACARLWPHYNTIKVNNLNFFINNFAFACIFLTLRS